MRKRDYSKYRFQDFLTIDDASPSGLIWTAPRKYFGSYNYDRVGKPAGNVRDFRNGKQRYWMVSLFGESFFCHRIIWLISKGSVVVENDIDHIDGNSLNNSLSNLREVPPHINARNSKKKVHGKELQTGVYYEELLSKSGTLLKRINAHVSIQPRKIVKKNFSVMKYGYEVALEMAISWRNSMIEKLNENGAGYTERHGT